MKSGGVVKFVGGVKMQIQLTVIIYRFHICKFIYSLKFVLPKSLLTVLSLSVVDMYRAAKSVSHLIHPFHLRLNETFLFQLLYYKQCPFSSLLSVLCFFSHFLQMFFTFLYFLLVILVFTVASKHCPEVLSSIISARSLWCAIWSK